MARRLALEEGLMVINLNDFKSVIVDTSVGSVFDSLFRWYTHANAQRNV
jgi:hypothetical protein